jgi:hypothetical protein
MTISSNGTALIFNDNSTQNTAYPGNTTINAAFTKANGAVQTAFVTHTANGTSLTPASNNDTLTITSAAANGINLLANSTNKTIDFGLRTSGVTAGVYGNTTTVPSITVDSFGRVTSVSNNTISAGGSSSPARPNVAGVVYANTTTSLTNLGYNAGLGSQSAHAVAIGNCAGGNCQGIEAIAIGQCAGNKNLGTQAIAIGTAAAKYGASQQTIAIGFNAGSGCTSCCTRPGGAGGPYSILLGTCIATCAPVGTGSIAIGAGAASGYPCPMCPSVRFGLGSCSIAIGHQASKDPKAAASATIAIGPCAGWHFQSSAAIAIGQNTGRNCQGTHSVAIGATAGSCIQGDEAVAIGYNAAGYNQQYKAVAIGTCAGGVTQGTGAVAIGFNAGLRCQGAYSIAVGSGAGANVEPGIANSAAYSITIGTNSRTTVANGANAIVIGTNSKVDGVRSVVIGANTAVTANSKDSIVIGTNARTNFFNSIALGTCASATSPGFYVSSNTASVTCGIRNNQTAGKAAYPVIFDPTSGEILHTRLPGFTYMVAPTSLSAATQLTPQNLLNGYIQYTGSAANLTLPTATALNTSANNGAYNPFTANSAWTLTIINTGSGAATLVANTGVTLIGSAAVTNATSGQFQIRNTSSTSFVVYRIH